MGTLEGVLLKDGGWRKGYRKRYFKMSKVYFQYFENEFCTSPKGAEVRGTIQNVEVSDLELLRFKITFKTEVWDLQAETKLDMIKWMETIKPNSTASIIDSNEVSSKTPNSTASNQLVTASSQSVITLDERDDETTYQDIPQSFSVNPRFSVSTKNEIKKGAASTSDFRTSSTSDIRTSSTSDSRTSSTSDIRTSSTSDIRISPTARTRNGSSCSAQSQQSVPSSPNETSARQPVAPPHQEIRATISQRISQTSDVQAQLNMPADFKPKLPLYTLSRDRKSGDTHMNENYYETPVESPPTQDLPTQDPSLSAQRQGSMPPQSQGPILPQSQGPSQQQKALSLNLNLSDDDDEFLDFDDDVGCYANDPQGTLDSMRKEVRSQSLTATLSAGGGLDAGDFTPVNPADCLPFFTVIPTTPEGTPSQDLDGLAVNFDPVDYTNGEPSKHAEYMNSTSVSIESDVSPIPLRRSIKSKSIADEERVHYSISIPTQSSEIETDAPSKPARPGELTLQRGDSSFLSVSSVASSAITTLRVQQWIKKVRTAKKEYVDPEEQDVGALDKFLMDHAKCLPKDNISLLQKIGNGAFGEVWQAQCSPPINGTEFVAVKCLKVGLSEKHRHDFYGEAALLGQFKHANVIALHGVILQDSSPWIVTEFAAKGALKSFLRKNERQSDQLLNYCRDIVRGMMYLSDRGYIHRDLSARNVLVTGEELCKIADFGLSRKLGDDDNIYVSRGGMVPIKWTAPEGVLAACYSSASDIWSCGVTMWEVFSRGANPWSGLSNEEAFRNIRRGGRLDKPEECPLDVYAAMLKCWPANPMERITFTDLDKELIRPDNLDGHVYQNTDDFGLYENLGYIETLLRENT